MHNLRPFSLEPLKSSSLIGVPVSIALSFGIFCNASGNVAQTFFAKGIDILLARPGDISDSCIITGTLLKCPPITTGTLTNPPLENIIFGLIFLIIDVASDIPFITRKLSVKFLKSKYLLSLPVDIS